MSSLLALILMEIFNFTNFTRDGIIRAGFNPYLDILGSALWGILFGFIGTGLYANSRSVGTTLIYLILIGIFTVIILPNEFIGLFSLILVFLVSIIFYKAFIERL